MDVKFIQKGVKQEMVLMLNPPSSEVFQDAAQAVHRTEGLHIQQVSPETLTELLGLPGMQVTHFAVEHQGEQKYLHLFCQHQYDAAICPRCGYDHKKRCVRHLNMWQMRTLIHFVQRRFECEVCGQP